MKFPLWALRLATHRKSPPRPEEALEERVLRLELFNLGCQGCYSFVHGLPPSAHVAVMSTYSKKFIVIIIENANKGNDIGQRSGGTSNSRFKRWGYHETEQKASSLVDISHRQVYSSALGGSIISKSSKKPKVLLNGFLTKRPPPIDKPRQASFACRGHSFSVQHHIIVNFGAVK